MKRVVAVLCMLLAASPVAAQYAYTHPKDYNVEIGVTAGYTLSEGFETEGFQFLGKPRRAEFVFRDDSLEMV